MARTKSADLSALAGMSNEAVTKQTGRTWEQWVKTLDLAGGKEMPHRELAQHVSSLGVSGWWSQAVTVGYERIRGLRQKGQRRGGEYEASKSRTFPVPVTKLFDAFSRLAEDEDMTVRTSTRPKTMRLSSGDGEIVEVYFTRKDDSKSTVAVQHTKLKSKAAVARTKSLWEERLEALSRELRTSR